MRKYDSCVNYDMILFRFETQVGALNLEGQSTEIDLIFDLFCNCKQKTCVNKIHVSVTTWFETQIGAKFLKRLERNSEIGNGTQGRAYNRKILERKVERNSRMSFEH